MSEPTKADRLILWAESRMREAEQMLERTMQLGAEVTTALQANARMFDEPQLCDMGFMFREIEQLLDEARKEATRRKDVMGTLLAAIIARRCVNGGEPKAAGRLATATIDVKTRVNMPKKGTPEWHSLLTHLGVSEEARQREVLQLHWTHVQEWITELESKGIAPPPELSKTLRTEATCTYRRKKRKAS